jgi:hypothetical protein
MSFYHARKAVRERIAKNIKKYREAPMRDDLEAQAIRALNRKAAAEKTQPVTNGKPVIVI